MKKNYKSILLILLPVLLIATWWQFWSVQPPSIPKFKDEASARQYLKTQVADGAMTELEARVRLAEALVQINKKDGKKDYIRKVMEKQGLTEKEAWEFLVKQKQVKGAKSKLQKNAPKNNTPTKNPVSKGK